MPCASLSLDLSALLLRVGFGLTLALTHGISKLKNPHAFLSHVTASFPAPTLLGWAAMLSEFAGGLLLAIGLFTRSAATLVATTLFVAAFKVHAADPFAKKRAGLCLRAGRLGIRHRRPRTLLDRSLDRAQTLVLTPLISGGRGCKESPGL